MRLRRSTLFLSLVTVTLAAGCGGDDKGSNANPIDYYQGELSAKLGADGNQARCSTCHSNNGDLAGFSGNSLKDIAYLTQYKGGDAAKLIDAVNACVTGWMGGQALTAEDDAYVLLEEYLQSISSESVTTPNPFEPEVLADEAAYQTAYAGGDAVAGEAKYAANCAKCHDAALKLGFTSALSKDALKVYTIGRIAQKVRTSGPPPSSSTPGAADTTGGPMPFFEPRELSADDLKDIIAHLKM